LNGILSERRKEGEKYLSKRKEWHIWKPFKAGGRWTPHERNSRRVRGVGGKGSPLSGNKMPESPKREKRYLKQGAITKGANEGILKEQEARRGGAICTV